MKKVKTCECSDSKKNIVLSVTRARGFLMVRNSALERNWFFYVFCFVFFSFITWFFSYIYLSIVNILVKANWRNLIKKVLLSREVPFCLL